MIIYGKNSVFEAIKNNPKDIKEIILSHSSNLVNHSKILNLANSYKIKTSILSKESLFKISKGGNHQGIVAKVKDFEYSDLNQILEISKETNQKAFILILDHIEDPHNLGAIIRTAEFLGIHGIIIPKNRASDVNPTVVKVSSGATKNAKIVKETNLSRVIDILKRKGIWIVGADSSSEKKLYEQALDDLDIALIIGNEGKGIGKKIKKKCDFLFSIPKQGKTESLNASVASSIFLYEIFRQRVNNK